MNREIKFRAWDKVEKKIRSVFEITYWELEPGASSRVLHGCKLGNMDGTRWWVYVLAENLELMQYTGLKDKSDKEIYEGDIVDYLDNTFQGLVKKTVVIEDIRHLPDFGCSKWEEIIGNIYEHPHLTQERDAIDDTR